MKKLIILILFLQTLSFSTKAQNFYLDKLHVFQWGYGYNQFSFDLPNNTSTEFTFSNMPLAYERYKRNTYTYSDVLTPIFDLCLGAFNSEYWYGFQPENILYSGGDWQLLRYAVGGYLGDHVGIYGGGQWGYSRWEVLHNGGSGFLYDLEKQRNYGGHTLGFGVHSVLDFDRILIRNSFMYDWITEGFSGPFYNQGFTYETTAMFGLTDDNMIGLFVSYTYHSRSEMQFSKIRFGLNLAFDN